MKARIEITERVHQISRRVFNEYRSEEAVKARYMRMRNVFMNICTFESHTGNGGDPDLPNSAPPNWKMMSMEDLEARFEKGRKAGKEYGALTATVYRYWQNQGWYDLFMNKCVVIQTSGLQLTIRVVTVR